MIIITAASLQGCDPFVGYFLMIAAHFPIIGLREQNPLNFLLVIRRRQLILIFLLLS